MTSVRERHLGWVTVDGQRFPTDKATDWIDAVEKGLCPFCGEGPFSVVALHVNRRHGLDRREFREVLGVSVGASVCHPDHHARLSAHAQSEGTVGRVAGRTTDEARKRAGKANSDRRRRENALRDQAIADAVRRGEEQALIAERYTLSPHTVRIIAERMGVQTDGRSIRGKRLKGLRPDQFRAHNEAQKAQGAAERAVWVARFHDGETIERLAEERDVTVKSMKQYLKGAGAEVPDGRKARTATMSCMVCPICACEFKRPTSQVKSNDRNRKAPAPTCCSLSCASKLRMQNRHA